MAQPAAPDISLAELDRLIRILGMLGSDHDGEVLAAARHAVRWVAEKGTDWQTLLVPPPEPLAVVSVSAPRDPDVLAQAAEADRVQAFKNGYQAGMADMARQLRAQAAMAAQPANPWNPNAQTFTTMAGTGPGAGLSGLRPGTPTGQGPQPQGPVAGSGGPQRAYPAGSWQAIAQALLDRHAQGVPGVLRSREEAFVSDILQRGFPSLSQAQEDWLRDIAARSAMSW